MHKKNHLVSHTTLKKVMLFTIKLTFHENVSIHSLAILRESSSDIQLLILSTRIQTFCHKIQVIN